MDSTREQENGEPMDLRKQISQAILDVEEAAFRAGGWNALGSCTQGDMASVEESRAALRALINPLLAPAPSRWPRGYTFRIHAEVLDGITVCAALLEEDYDGRWTVVRETNEEYTTLDDALCALAADLNAEDVAHA